MVCGIGGAYFSVYTDALQATYKGETVTFIKFYRLKGIDLSANQFTGEIPSELGLLSASRTLNMSRNRIRGSIPDELGRLVYLESLDLSWNDLSGLIPLSLTSLTFLSLLNLSYNDLSGKIPSGHQFLTFSENPYLGNLNVWGLHCQESVYPIAASMDTINFIYILIW